MTGGLGHGIVGIVGHQLVGHDSTQAGQRTAA
jgi:hypothetical protein